LKKIITVDGKQKHVFVLRETDQHFVYISLHHIDRVDYDRMKQLTKDTDVDLLEAMKTHRFDNGVLGLNLYREVIKTARKHEVKATKPSVYLADQPAEPISPEGHVNTPTAEPTGEDLTKADEVAKKPPTTPVSEKPRRRPGRPKKNPAK